MIFMFAVVERELLIQAQIGKLNGDIIQPLEGTIQYPSVLDVWFLLHIGKD